jgi:hypothetical protein
MGPAEANPEREGKVKEGPMTSAKTAAETGKANEPSATGRLLEDGQLERGYGDYGGCALKSASEKVKVQMEREGKALKWKNASKTRSGTDGVWIHDRLWRLCWFILPIACCVFKSVMVSFRLYGARDAAMSVLVGIDEDSTNRTEANTSIDVDPVVDDKGRGLPWEGSSETKGPGEKKLFRRTNGKIEAITRSRRDGRVEADATHYACNKDRDVTKSLGATESVEGTRVVEEIDSGEGQHQRRCQWAPWL